jgi:DNA-binding CsgD family transcriptional regulator
MTGAAVIALARARCLIGLPVLPRARHERLPASTIEALAALFAGEHDRARVAALEVLAALTGAACGEAHGVLALVALEAGDVQAAHDHAELGVRHAAAGAHHPAAHSARWCRGALRQATGDHAGALAEARHADRDGTSQPFVSALVATAQFHAGDWRAVDAALEDGMRAADATQVRAADPWLAGIAATVEVLRAGRRPAGAPPLSGHAQFGRAWCDHALGIELAANGRTDQAADVLAAVVERGERSGTLLSAPELLRAGYGCGDRAAVVVARRALQRFAAGDALAAAHGAWAQAFLAGDPDTLAALAGRIAAVRPVSAATWLADAARAAASTSVADARAYGTTAIDALARIGADAAAARLRAELRAAGIALRPARARTLRAPAAITPTEQTVIELVAEGMSNAEIADRLVMSRRTVEAHLAHVYTKAGITTRVELIRRLVTGDPIIGSVQRG